MVSNQPKACWPTQKAKTEFSRLLRDSQHRGDQIITTHNEPVAVLISKKRYDQLVRKENSGRKNSLLDFFQKAPLPDVDIPIERNKDLI